MATPIVIKVITDGGEQTLKNLNDLQVAIKQLEASSSSLDLGSKAFEDSKNQIDELKAKLAELGKSQQELDAELTESTNKSAEERARALEKTGNEIRKLARGLTEAFSGAFLVLGASKDQSEEFNKNLEKGVGIAMGVRGGIEAIGAGMKLAVPAIDAFNAALLANPVALIAAAVIVLAGGIALLVIKLTEEESELDKAKTRQDAYNESKKNATEVTNALVGAQDAYIQKLTLEGASEDTIAKARKVNTEARISLNKAEAQNIADNFESLDKAAKRSEVSQEEYDKKLASLKANQTANQLEYTKLVLESNNVETKSLQDAASKQKAILDKEEAERKAAQDKKNAADKAAEAARKAADAARIAANQKLNDQIALENINAIKDEYARAVAKAKNEQSIRDREIIASKAGEKEKNAAIIASEIQLNTDLDALEEKHVADLKVIDDKIDADFKALLKQQAQDKIDAAKKEEEDNKKKVKAAQDIAEAVAQVAIQALNTVEAVVDQIAADRVSKIEESTKVQTNIITSGRDKETASLNAQEAKELKNKNLTEAQKHAIQLKYDNLKIKADNKAALETYALQVDSYNRETEIKKKAFETDKKLKIASTIIAGVLGAIQAFNSLSAIPFVGDVLGAVAAASVAAMAAVSVDQIEGTTFDAGTPPTPPKLEMPAVPDDSSSGSGSGPQSAPNLYGIRNSDNSNAPINGGGSNQPIKAYVVSQEVTTSQNMNATIGRRSSF